MTTQGTPFLTNWGEAGTWYEGQDDRGIMVEIGTVQRGLNEMVIHAMPLESRHKSEKE
ncbi:MAG: hypothetical protein LBK95_11835 [Bifidobacteriaceae bacterium]|jgi:hypothetical protein|nr:hypothetical protein [Bifidobacteriaceae bacterium]